MTIDPTRKEWLAARARMDDVLVHLSSGDLDSLTEAALGCPCPPEPAPDYWRTGEAGSGCLGVARHADGGVWVGFPDVKHEQLTPDEADAMAGALIEHARYAREQEAKEVKPTRDAPVAGPLIPAPICGRGPNCQRPKGHAEVCQPSAEDDL